MTPPKLKSTAYLTTPISHCIRCTTPVRLLFIYKVYLHATAAHLQPEAQHSGQLKFEHGRKAVNMDVLHKVLLTACHIQSPGTIRHHEVLKPLSWVC